MGKQTGEVRRSSEKKKNAHLVMLWSLGRVCARGEGAKKEINKCNYCDSVTAANWIL